MERLSVVGLVEGLRRAPELLPARSRLIARWVADPPDVFVGVDAPDFNLGLERRLRARGVPTVHYVSPSVWAWRRYRVRKVARAVDRLLVLFPFEADFYDRHGVPARFVGHPLADRIPLEPDVGEARRELGLPEGGEWVALLPGSRVGEVSRLAGPLIGAAHWLRARRPGLGFLVPAANAETRAVFEAVLRRQGQDLPLRLFDGRGRTVMAAADVVLLASGTATLEALLLKRPMVVTYRLSALTYGLAKRLVRVPYVALPNLLAGRERVPELLQDRATPDALGAAVLRYLETPGAVAALQASFREIHRALRRGADERAAEAVLEILKHP
jgi:lipid-A-disaccharide synthase